MSADRYDEIYSFILRGLYIQRAFPTTIEMYLRWPQDIETIDRVMDDLEPVLEVMAREAKTWEHSR